MGQTVCVYGASDTLTGSTPRLYKAEGGPVSARREIDTARRALGEKRRASPVVLSGSGKRYDL